MRHAGATLASLALLVSCGREIAQTATRDPDAAAALETSCAQSPAALPVAPAWISGDLELTPLIATSYGAGEGPGLYIAARDAYRVYLNGAPIFQSRAPRTADFVPLSLRPGDNRLAIAVWAEEGTPAAILQLDDLSESYLSDDGWRAETSPGVGFAQTSDDDGAGERATEHGRLGSLPGCDPPAPFPQTSLARWIGPASGAGSSVLLRRVIRVAPVGFGENATGGDGVTPTVVSSYAELEAVASEPALPAVILIPEGDYDFRRKGDEINLRLACPSACPDDPSKTLYRILTTGETCATEQVMVAREERTLHLGSNKTIVGLGRGAHLRGVSIDFGAEHNIVLRNLALYDVNRGLQEAGDALGMKSPSNVWLDHVTTKWISDGHADISAGTQGVTLSWMHYDGASSADCRGRHTHVSSITDASVTLHHSFFDHADSHAPLVTDAQARVHIFNNLVQDNDGYGVAAACGAQVRLEGTTFRAVRTPTSRRDCSGEPPGGLIFAADGSNLYLQDVGDHAGADGKEPQDAVFEPGYVYRAEPAAQSWPRVLNRAGVGGPWRRALTVEP